MTERINGVDVAAESGIDTRTIRRLPNGVSAEAECVRAGIDMTADEWFAVPPEVRRRYWEETDWGKNNSGASPEVVKLIVQHLGRRETSRSRF